MTTLPKRVLATSIALALPASLLLSGSATGASATTQTGSCVDGGGVRWNTKVVWGGISTGDDGIDRVSVYDAAWTTNGRTVKTDARIRAYDGAGKLIETLDWTGSFDYALGRTYKVRNPRNPVVTAGRAQVKLTLGVDGDGFGDCTVTFTEPKADPTPTPTPTPQPTPTPTSTPTPTPPGSTSDRYESDVVTATNQERRAQALTALATQACVDGYAESQAEAMAAESRMYHQDLGPILRACNLHMVGENVAYGYPSGAAVTAAWLASPGHRANILNPGYRLLGVGAVQDSTGRWYAAQVFGAA